MKEIYHCSYEAVWKKFFKLEGGWDIRHANKSTREKRGEAMHV